MKEDFDYLSYGPTQKPAKKLVILLHGYGRDATLMGKLAEQIQKDVPDALIISPHAPELCHVPNNDDGNELRVPQIVRDDKNQKPGNQKRQWFTINGDRDVLVKNLSKSAIQMNKFIDMQRDTLGITDKDIALMGFSQGGGVALYAAFIRPQTLGCLVIHSTPFFPDKTMTTKPETFYIYGTADEEFSQKIYQDSVAHLKKYLADLTVKTIPGLSHKTNDESRKETSLYIKNRLSQPKP